MKNNFLNAVKVIQYQNSMNTKEDLFEEDEGPLDCILAILAVGVSVAGLTACLTVVLCGIAVIGYLIAVRNFIKHCSSLTL